MWTISDFPAYGLISGQQTKGYHACPCCGPLTDSKKIRGPSRDKIVYLGMRKRLLPRHEYRTNKRFNGSDEHGTAPPRLCSSDILHYAAERQEYLDNGGAPDGRDDPVHRTGMKRQSVLYDLPYWKVISYLLLFFLFFLIFFFDKFFIQPYPLHMKPTLLPSPCFRVFLFLFYVHLFPILLGPFFS
jgi:hypothetical protein